MGKHTVIVIMILVYIAGISGYGYYSYSNSKRDIYKGIDKQLQASASAIPMILGESYHHQNMNIDSISKKTYKDTIDRLTKYAKLAGVKYLYSFIRVDNTIRFTSSSYTPKELKEGSFSNYWDEYKGASDTLKSSFYSDSILFEESSDNWGTFRSVLIPIRDGKLTYVVGADIETNHIESLLQRELIKFALTSMLFLLVLIPLILLYLKTIEREKRHLEEIINTKTAELQAINSDLKNLSTQLSKYLAPQLYNSIFSSKQEVKIETKRKKLTIFFSDIKNFTKTTEYLEPEDLTNLLNNYLNEMSIIALKHGATIDKFIGDAIVIFFGDPQSSGVEEDALLCVSMAIEMKQRMEILREQWLRSGIAQPFEIRIGINTGYCTVGNFGSESRLDYTIIGNHVNLASRIESNAEVNEILISEDTYLLIKEHINCIKKELIHVKGFEHPIQTYQVSDVFHRNVIKEEQDGFSLSIDFDNRNINKEEVIKRLERTLKQLKEDEKE